MEVWMDRREWEEREETELVYCVHKCTEHPNL